MIENERKFRKMWQWIADETRKRKRRMGKWEYFNAFNIPEMPFCDCYACEEAIQRRLGNGIITGNIPTHTRTPLNLRNRSRRWNGGKKKMYKFKNGDRILVANEDEYKRLLGLLHEQGYEWEDGSSLLDETECDWDSITNVKFDKVIISIHKTKSRKRVTWNNINILPYSAISTTDESEITAVEAI